MILERTSGPFSCVMRAWTGQTVALFGGGESLTLDQVDLVAALGLRSIAVNDAYLIAPFADVCYFADSDWWRWHCDGIDKPVLGLTRGQVRERFATFHGQKCSIQGSGNNVLDPAVHLLRNVHYPRHGQGLSRDPGALVTGRHSGHQALNLAILAGAARVLLFGFDGKPGEKAAHFHGEHPRPTPPCAYKDYRKSFEDSAQAIADSGVAVINCNPGSAIDTFPKMEAREALA